MAKLSRSIWEVRFYAVQELINRHIKNIKTNAGKFALDDNLSKIEKDAFNAQLEMLGALKTRASLFETQCASSIWLERD